jgi:hypothetical protein
MPKAFPVEFRRDVVAVARKSLVNKGFRRSMARSAWFVRRCGVGPGGGSSR